QFGFDHGVPRARFRAVMDSALEAIPARLPTPHGCVKLVCPATHSNIRVFLPQPNKRAAVWPPFECIRREKDYLSSLPLRSAAPRMSPSEAPESDEPYCATASFSS